MTRSMSSSFSLVVAQKTAPKLQHLEPLHKLGTELGTDWERNTREQG